MFVIARPQSIVFRRGAGEARPNRFPARIAESSFLGDGIEVDVECDAIRLKLMVDSYADLEVGAQGTIDLPPERLVVVPHDASVL